MTATLRAPPVAGRRCRLGAAPVLLLLVAVIAMPAFVTAGAAWLAWNRAWREARHDIARSADIGAEYARRLFDGLAQRADTVNEILRGVPDAEIRANEAAYHDRLRRIPARSGDLATFHVFLHDREARSLASGALYPVPGRDRSFAHREFNQALRTADVLPAHVSPVYVGEAINRRFFAVSRRREGAGNGMPQGAYDGLIAISVDVASIEAAIRPMLALPGDGMTLLRADGAVLVHAPEGGSAAPPRLPAADPLLARMTQDALRGLIEDAPPEDAPRLLAFRKVEGWPIYVAASRPRAAIMANWRQAVMAELAIGVPAMLALLGLALAVRRGQRDLAAANAGLEQGVAERTAALVTSEERLRRAQQIGRVGGFEIDIRTGANRRSAEYMALQGLNARETLERHEDWVRRLHPEDRARAERRFLDAIADDGPDTDYAQEYRIITADGEVRWISARAEIERDAQGRTLRMVGAHVDVTELRAAQAALAEADQRSREVLESLGDMLYALDAEGRIRFGSRRALEAWGRTPDTVMGQRLTTVFPALGGTTTWSAIEEATRQRTERHLCAVSPLFGRWFELDIHPAAGGGVTVAARDIDDRRRLEIARRRAETALRDSEARLRLALDAARMGIWEVDFTAATVVRSPRTLEIFGYPDADQVGRYPSWRDRIHAEDRPLFEAALAPLRAGAVDRYHVQYRFQRPDGAWRWVESHGLAVASDPVTGAATRVIGTMLDITERRAAEERQKLLAREVDHRAKNALSVVQAALRLTPKRDAATFAAAIEGRVRAIARAQSLLAEGRWSGADLRTVAAGELSAFFGAGATAPRAELSGPPLQLRPEAVQAISMALHELSTNATKYGALSVPGGLVRLDWRRDDRLRLRWQESGGPPVQEAPDRQGFGSRLLLATIRDQLGGEVTLRWDQGGLVCDMAIPLARVLADGDTLLSRAAAE